MSIGHNQSPALVADIGGTNARFGVLYPGERRPCHIRKLSVNDYGSIDAAIQDYLAQVGDEVVPAEACLAIASPVHQDRVAVTNSPWSFSKERLQRSLGLQRLVVINDYAAQAYGIPSLEMDALFQIGGGEGVARQPLAVLGPGTGFGVGALVRPDPDAVVVVSEGGHVDFAPANELEIEVLRYLWRQHEHVSVERLLSGAGLTNLHQAIASVRGLQAEVLVPEQISSQALEHNDPLCLEVLGCFCAVLGAVAGNAALMLGARGGIFITSGIIPPMAKFLADSDFRRRFEAKGRFRDYVAAIPTYVVVAEQAGLIGAATLLRTSDNLRGCDGPEGRYGH
ncbi:glucokinase [Aestuariirhabdus sp. LZHN29]|uniref:glucokinase n=1 Tax=Aestuariirhabdus sp. LZHN29 TaxID=3417462 RepID=UPI003CF20F32